VEHVVPPRVGDRHRSASQARRSQGPTTGDAALSPAAAMAEGPASGDVGRRDMYALGGTSGDRPRISERPARGAAKRSGGQRFTRHDAVLRAVPAGARSGRSAASSPAKERRRLHPRPRFAGGSPSASAPARDTVRGCGDDRSSWPRRSPTGASPVPPDGTREPRPPPRGERAADPRCSTWNARRAPNGSPGRPSTGWPAHSPAQGPPRPIGSGARNARCGALEWPSRSAPRRPTTLLGGGRLVTEGRWVSDARNVLLRHASGQ
jgi:hypothetical protein